MSTVLLGFVDPGLEVTTILWHQMAGVLGGSSSMMPIFTSLSIPSFTCCLQCKGTLRGMVWQVGTAPGLMASLSSWPLIPGRTWCGQVLKVDALK